MNVYKQIFWRDLLVIARSGSDWISAVVFFSLVVLMVPIVVVPMIPNCVWFMPVIIWMAMLLAVLLAQDVLWRDDYLNGVLQQLMIAHVGRVRCLLSRLLVHWLIYLVPLVTIAGLFAMSVGMPLASVRVLCYSMVLGSPLLVLLGSLCGALTVTLPRSGVLLTVLSLPLYAPVLILGCGAVMMSLNGFGYSGQFALLLAMDLLAVLLIPYAIFVTLRESIG